MTTRKILGNQLKIYSTLRHLSEIFTANIHKDQNKVIRSLPIKREIMLEKQYFFITFHTILISPIIFIFLVLFFCLRQIYFYFIFLIYIYDRFFYFE